MDARTIRSERAMFAVLVIVYLALSLLVFNQIEEDAYIYFRFVHNLAQGNGYVFNPGGEHVEAGSSPLWMLLLFLFWKAPLDIVITAKILGLAAGCVSLWLVLCISRLHFPDSVLRFGPPLLTVGSTPFLMWSQRGLETPLFVLIVLWLALCCTDRRRFRWWPLPGVLLLLARPEGALYLLGLLPVLGLDRGRWRAARQSMLVVASAAVAIAVARFIYFHDLVPWPFYVKLHSSGRAGLFQIRQYIEHNHFVVLGSPLVLVVWNPRFWSRQRVVLAGFVLIAAVWCALAKDYMPYVRHLVPAIPLAYVLMVGAADTLVAGMARWRTPLVLGYVAVVFVTTLFFSRSSRDFGEDGQNAVRQYLHALVRDPGSFARATVAKFRDPTAAGLLDEVTLGTHTLGTNYQSRVGEFVRRNYPVDSVVVYDQMGQTPFYAGPTMRFIDSLGLTDRTIGRFYFDRSKRGDALLRTYDVLASHALNLAFGERREEVTEENVLDYVFGLNPDLILINTWAVEKDATAIPAQLRRDPRLTDTYELRYKLGGGVLAYERKDAPQRPSLDVPAGLVVVRP